MVCQSLLCKRLEKNPRYWIWMDKLEISTHWLLLQEIEKKYPGFIHMKLLQGIRLSFRVQQIVQGDPVIVRGSRVVNEGEPPSAMNGYLYSIMKNTKTQRRGILMSLLKQFDESSVRNYFTTWFIKGVSVYECSLTETPLPKNNLQCIKLTWNCF